MTLKAIINIISEKIIDRTYLLGQETGLPISK